MNDEELRQDGELLEETQVSQGNTENVQQETDTAEQETAVTVEYEESADHPQPTMTRKRKKRRRRMKRILKTARPLFLAVVIVLAVLLVRSLLDLRTSSSYSVLSSTQREASTKTTYLGFAGAILHYSSDGAALVSADGEQIWNETFDMNTPVAAVNGDAAVVYDQKGTSMCVFNGKGLLGKVTTELPILKARVSSQGMIAAILEDKETTWINFYSPDGQTIATGKTRIDSPGYPVDLDVSDNGELLVVSYIYVDGNTPTSYVAFYNFGTTGQNQMDNMVSGYTYPDVLVPQVRFLSDDTAAAVRDDGITIYRGSQIPAESFSTDTEAEIVSCFVTKSSVGLVTANTEEGNEDPYRLQLFNLKGKMIADESFQTEYTTIRADGDRILLYNDKQLGIFDLSGHEKFHGVIEEGTIQDVCTISKDRFLVVMNESIATIKIR